MWGKQWFSCYFKTYRVGELTAIYYVFVVICIFVCTFLCLGSRHSHGDVVSKVRWSKRYIKVVAGINPQ